MKALQLIVDNSAAILSWLTGLFGILLLLKIIDLDETQISAIVAFVGLTIGLLAGFLTTAKRTVVTQVDNSGVIRAGAASTTTTGQPTPVSVNEDGSLVPQVTVDPALAVAGPK